MPTSTRRTHAWTAPGGERYEAERDEEGGLRLRRYGHVLIEPDATDMEDVLEELLSLADHLERAKERAKERAEWTRERHVEATKRHAWEAGAVRHEVACAPDGEPYLMTPGGPVEGRLGPLALVMRELLSLAERLERAEGSWQLMATAPRDGTRILVDFARIGVHAVAWTSPADSEFECWCVDDRKHGPFPLRGYVETDACGWRELPKGPA